MSTIKDIARVLVERHKLKVGASEAFLQQMVEVINEGLIRDRLVKIKGFGTFKLQEVKERSSVNVNTGERVVIAAHDKVSFTPDNLMRDMVNKPFSHFETIIMSGDGNLNVKEEIATDNGAVVDGDASVEEATVAESSEKVDVQTENENDEAQAKDFEETADAPSVAGEPENAVADKAEESTDPEREPEPEEEKTDEEKVEVAPAPEKAPEPESIPETEPVSEQTEQKQTAEQSTEDAEQPADSDDETCNRNEATYDDTDSKKHIYYLVMINILVATVFFALGYLASSNKWLESGEPIKVEIVKDTPKAATTQKPKKAESKAKSEVIKKETEVKPESPKLQNEVDYSKYDYDARVKYGAYVIVGTEKEITVKEGQTLKGISKAILGPDMECYIEVYNGDVKEVRPGDKLRIPKLKTKRSLKK